MENDRNNCGMCFFHKDLKHPGHKITCYVWWEDGWRDQYDACKHWLPHTNDPVNLKESRAKEIRNRIEKEKQNQVAENQHEKIRDVVKEQGKKGGKTTRFWAIFGIIFAIIIFVLTLIIFL